MKGEISLVCNEGAFKDMNFDNLERMETKNNPADSLYHTKSTTPVLKR